MFSAPFYSSTTCVVHPICTLTLFLDVADVATLGHATVILKLDYWDVLYMLLHLKIIRKHQLFKIPLLSL